MITEILRSYELVLQDVRRMAGDRESSRRQVSSRAIGERQGGCEGGGS